MTEKSSTTWRDFENSVSALYELLGFDVEQDVDLSGQQVDIIAEKVVSGMGATRTIVECKFHLSGNVSNQDVQDFAATFISLAPTNQLTYGALVTNTGFTKQAKSTAASIPNLSLLTVADLEEQVFSIAPLLRDWVADYESQKIFNSYVSSGFKIGEKTNSDVEAALLRWIDSDASGFITILGDFGAGKTTLLERTKYKIAKSFLGKRSSVKPVFFKLKEFHSCGTLDGLVQLTLRREFRQDIPLSVFWNAANRGAFVLLLDGFDEMAREVDARLRATNLIRLGRLLTTRSRACITCRPSYFISNDELIDALKRIKADASPQQRLGGSEISASLIGSAPQRRSLRKTQAKVVDLRNHIFAEVVAPELPHITEKHIAHIWMLEKFTSSDIEKYLSQNESAFQSSIGQTWQDVLRFLEGVYDLSDLMTRPILIKMIVETLLSGYISISDANIEIGPASLYEIYTTMELEREHSKGATRRLMTISQRLQFAEVIAVTMYEKDRLQASHGELVDCVRQVVKSPELASLIAESTIEQISSDVQLCTFLHRGTDDLFVFAHKSFMEFFVARYISRVVAAGNPDYATELRLLEQPLPVEIIYFLRSMSRQDPQLQDRFEKEMNSESKAMSQKCRSNLVSSVLSPGVSITGVKAAPCNIVYDTTDVTLKECDLRRMHFMDSSVTKMNSYNSKLIDNTFSRVELSGWNDKGSRIEWTIENCEIDELALTDSVAKVSFRDSKIKDSKFIRGSFAGSSIVGSSCDFDADIKVRLSESSFAGSRFGRVELNGRKLLLRECQARGSQVRLENSSVSGTSFLDAVVQQEEGEIDGCTFKGKSLLDSRSGSSLNCDFRSSKLSFTKARIASGTCSEQCTIKAVDSRFLHLNFAESAVTLASCDLEDCYLSNGSNIVFQRGSMTNGRFRGVSVGEFSSVGITRCEFEDAKFTRATDCRFERDCSFKSMNGSFLRCDFEGCSFDNCDMESFANCRLINCRSRECKFDFDGLKRVEQSTFRKCDVSFKHVDSGSFDFDGTRFVQSKVIGAKALAPDETVNASGAAMFEQCEFCLMPVNAGAIQTLLESGCSGIVIDCSRQRPRGGKLVDVRESSGNVLVCIHKSVPRKRFREEVNATLSRGGINVPKWVIARI